MTVAYSRCFDCRSLLSKTINWQFIFRQRRLFHFTSCFLNFIGILGLSFHIIFVCGFLSLRSLNINALSQMEESHSLILLNAARSKSAHNVKSAHLLFCCSSECSHCLFFFAGNHCDSKEFQWKWYIYTLTHIPLRSFKWMICLNAAKFVKNDLKNEQNISIGSTHLSS